MIKQLVSFGCSWVYGDELVDPMHPTLPPHHPDNKIYRESHSFGGLIAEQHNWTYKCLAEPGSSNTSMKWSVIEWLEQASKEEIQESFLLVGLTTEYRNSWLNPHTNAPNAPGSDYIHSTSLNMTAELADTPNFNDWRELNKLQQMLIDCTKSYQINYNNVTRTIDGISARYNIPTIQFNVLTALTTPVLPTLAVTKSIELFLEQAKSLTTQKLVKKRGHPDEKGHTLIAQYLESHVHKALK